MLFSALFNNVLNFENVPPFEDYNMLEDVKRVAESGRRFRFKTPPHFRLPYPLKSLRSAASSRRTKLLFFSSGMSKREKNRTYYNYRLLSILKNFWVTLYCNIFTYLIAFNVLCLFCRNILCNTTVHHN